MTRLHRHALYLLYRLGIRTSLGRSLVAQVPALALRESLISDFIHGGYGRDYGITERDRARLVSQFGRNVASIQSGTSDLLHLLMARDILAVPPHIQGDVIECGVWKGASTASLSLVCRLVGRRLLVCDSFQGLPDDEQVYRIPHTGAYGYLRQGMFAGSIDEVRANLRSFGDLDSCEFIEGFFADSLRRLSQPLVFAFLDVDLEQSIQQCVRAIWPLLVEDSVLYVDDVGCMEIVRVFFDEPWWHENLGCDAPGFIGGGCGLPIMPTYSNVGYTRKRGPFAPERWHTIPDLYYPDPQLTV